jgi:hypothetical protein
MIRERGKRGLLESECILRTSSDFLKHLNQCCSVCFLMKRLRKMRLFSPGF